MQLRRLMALAAIVFAAAALQASDHYERTFSKTLTLRAGRVTVDHKFGAIRIHSTPGSEVNVRASIRASDADFGKQIGITVTEGGGGVEIRTSYPEGPHFHLFGEFSYSVELDVSVPENTPVTVHNRFGSIDATGLKGGSELLGGQGFVVSRHTRGSLKVENSFGSVDAEDVQGDLTITNANGSVRAAGVHGSLTLTDRFASITVSDVGGDADVQGGNGSIELKSVHGKATVHNSFGSTRVADVGHDLVFTGNNSRVDASNIGGGANITTTFDNVTINNVGGLARVSNSNGAVTVTDAKSDLNVDTRFASVRADRIHGSADVDNANGSVTLNDVGGSVKVHTSFASAFVKNVGGSVDVRNQNGAISIAGVHAGACHPITLNTTFAPIRLTLNSDANYDVSARTSFGHITTDIPVTTNGAGEDMLNGRMGKGGCRLELTDANGGITIGRE